MSKRLLGSYESEVSEVESGEESDVVPVPTEEEQLPPKKTNPRRKSAASRVMSSFMREEQFKAEMKDSKLLFVCCAYIFVCFFMNPVHSACS